MRPVAQTRFGYPEGNCMMACVASILEVSLEDLPDLFDECCEWWEEKKRWKHGDWWGKLREGARAFGWDIVYVSTEDFQGIPAGYCMAGGDSPRSEVTYENGKNAGHVVVYLDGGMAHDPHPSGDGLDGPVEEWYIFLKPSIAYMKAKGAIE